MQSGLISKGNVDLYSQPEVKNPDGSTSTVDSRSYNIDGKEVLLPSVTPDGRHLKTDDEIINEYKKTGRHLGMFDTPENATTYASQLHEDYAAGKYRKNKNMNGLLQALLQRIQGEQPQRQISPAGAERNPVKPFLAGQGAKSIHGTGPDVMLDLSSWAPAGSGPDQNQRNNDRAGLNEAGIPGYTSAIPPGLVGNKNPYTSAEGLSRDDIDLDYGNEGSSNFLKVLDKQLGLGNPMHWFRPMDAKPLTSVKTTDTDIDLRSPDKGMDPRLLQELIKRNAEADRTLSISADQVPVGRK